MKLALLAALALPLTGAAQTGDPQSKASPTEPQRATRNMLDEPRPGCTPIVVQVAGEYREYRGTRLDQQPPSRLIYAVDRRVDGCREVTFVNEQRVGPPPLAPQMEPSPR